MTKHPWSDDFDLFIIIVIAIVIVFGFPYAIGYFGNKIIAGGTPEENHLIGSIVMIGTIVVGRIIKAIYSFIQAINEN